MARFTYLTPHQRDVLDQLARRSHQERARDGWVAGDSIGSAGSLARLVEKGHAERQTRIGPRGGEHHYYRPSRP